MTIRMIAQSIIESIKAWPEETRQSQDEAAPKTSWDEYKEQIQYEEYDSFEIFEETLESMVDDEVSELSDKVINNIYGSIFIMTDSVSIDDKRNAVVNEVLSYIKNEAESEPIEYCKLDPQFVRYSIVDLTIVAEISSKVGPEEFLIRSYSEVTGMNGEQGVVNISDLADEQGFEWISPEEFDRSRKSLYSNQLKQNEESIIKSRRDYLKEYLNNPEFISRRIESSKRLKAQSEERMRKILELQSQMDQQGIPLGELREVRFKILDLQLGLDNILDDVKRAEQSQADMRLIPEIQNELILLRDKEKSICDVEKSKEAMIA